MDIEQQLNDAVLNAPDNDAPRLAYAGWCDSQSERIRIKRGVFIRQQVELAIPATQTSPSRIQLNYQSESMQREYGTAWAASLASLASNFRFDRGFVELIALTTRKFLDHADAIFAIAPIRHIDLSDVRPCIDELLASPHLQRIRSLSLRRCDLNDAHITQLADCPNLTSLRWLSLMENRIGMPGAEALAASINFPCLTYVVFNGNLVEPNDEHFHDSGMIVESARPYDGRTLEAKFGPLRWLHHVATSLADTIPDRFRIACASQA